MEAKHRRDQILSQLPAVLARHRITPDRAVMVKRTAAGLARRDHPDPTRNCFDAILGALYANEVDSKTARQILIALGFPLPIHGPLLPDDRRKVTAAKPEPLDDIILISRHGDKVVMRAFFEKLIGTMREKGLTHEEIDTIIRTALAATPNNSMNAFSPERESPAARPPSTRQHKK